MLICVLYFMTSLLSIYQVRQLDEVRSEDGGAAQHDARHLPACRNHPDGTALVTFDPTVFDLPQRLERTLMGVPPRPRYVVPHQCPLVAGSVACKLPLPHLR